MRETSVQNALRLPILACSVFALIPACAVAADSLRVQNLGTSEILRPEPSTFAEESPSFIAIDSKAWEGKNVSAGELLSKEAGIQMQKFGGMGSFETVSVRGAAAKTVLICIDGVPVEDAGGGAVSLGSIDLNQVERVEIYKSYAPAKFGGNAIGGVINFISKSEAKNRNRVLASYGSHNAYEVSYSVSHELSQSLQFSSLAGFRHSDNDYEFLDRNGTKFNTDDDTVRTRKNADYSQFSGTHKLRYLHGNGAFSNLIVTHSNDWGGNPGKESNQTVVAGFEKSLFQTKYLWEAPYEKTFRPEISLAGKIDKSVSSSYYPLDKIGYNYNQYLEYGAIAYTARPELRLIFEPANSPKRLHGTVNLSADFERIEDRDNNTLGSRYDWSLEKIQGDVAAEFGLSPIPLIAVDWNLSGRADWLHRSKGILFNAVSRDTVDDERTKHFYWAGRTSIRIGKSEWPVQGFGAVAKYFRAPQTMELYGVREGVIPNPDLKAERGFNFEAGIRASEKKFRNSLQILYFETHSKNGIVWVSSANFVKPLNSEKTRTRGVEVEWENKTFSWLDLSFKGTVQDPRDLSDISYLKDKLLVNEPVRSFHLTGTFHLPWNFDLAGELHRRSRIFTDRANRERVSPETLLHASLAHNFRTNTRVTLAVNNITDEDHQNIYDSYPKPGREYKATVVQDF